ncbi:MAG: hypothetical protein UV73_C0005G0042 [Candidatus Gottesmanbacteria bacterium GW2011_GWA2_43_14]|uniref:Uncharacterized protein n=1 Tax=Candidatus Gottesmanbacteria bacterium GW2011_GWA2_43_14 TaxID=1618443 RepID=A0A0G1DIU1_9BACT|nr:MAG: hypothetical protein UV73_C0005G0042 [Candidatus Gottesmanbacteria bacterium GW2011_GWA2_43_14]
MGFLRTLWSAWKKLAHRLGVFQSKVILTVFYFLILSPFGLLYSLFKDELKIKKQSQSSWLLKKSQTESIAELTQQA